MADWNPEVNELFAKVIELESPEEQRALLDETCGENADLRSGVERLLKAHNDAGSFLNKPPDGLAPTITTGEHDTVDDSEAEFSLDFLNPTDKPNCLGTLAQYEAIEAVGRGGMGLVLRAYDTKLNRVVAIKVMAPELAANPMAVKRFLREARAAAAVSHEHVVTIHAIEEDNTPPFIVMEFVDGKSLQEKVDETGSLGLKEILRIGMQTARGLSAAHEQGLVHRDVKPANILLENGVERVQLTDFGLARATDDVSVTQTGHIAGTPQYMSPEQAEGKPLDARSDLFSLGSVLYTMCTGRPPFRAESAVAMLRRVTEDEPRPIRELNDDVPEWLEAIIAKLLAKNPSERIQSADEVGSLLGQHLAHLQDPQTTPLPDSVEAPGDVEGASEALNWGLRWLLGIVVAERTTSSRRRPLVLTAVSALFLAVLAVVVFYIQTNNGVVRVEVTDPSLQVTIRGQTITMNDNDKPLTIRAGEQKLVVRRDDSDFELTTVRFRLIRNDEIVFKVELLSGEVVVSKDGKRFGAKTLVPKTRDEPTEFYHALDEARLAAFVQKIAEDEKDGTIVGGWTANPPYSIRETSWIDDIDPRIILHVYAGLSEFADDHGLTIEGGQQEELQLKSFNYSTTVREGEVVLTLASRDAPGLSLVQARKVILSVAVNEWPKGERPRKNEFRVVVYKRADSEIVEISGPRIRKAGDLSLVTKELLPLIAKYAEPVVLLAAGQGEGANSDDTATLLKSVQKLLIAAGAVVKLDPRLSSPTMAAMERPDSRVNRRRARLNLLTQVGIGLLNYDSFKKSFPPAKQNSDEFDDDGRPHLSWRVHILPYIEQEELFARFRLDEPWDSDHNRALLDQMPDIYKTTDDPTKTTVLAVVGEGTAYGGKSGLKMFDFDRGDGRSRTAYAVDAGRERAVPWTKPEDLPFDKEDPIRAVGTSDFGDELLVLMADASVQSIPYDTAPESLRALFTRAAGDTFDETAKRTTPLPSP